MKTTPNYDGNDYNQVHARRYQWSMVWILGLLPAKGGRVLELGGGGEFTRLLREARPDVELVLSEGDLRSTRLPDGPFDLVLCMEVIEHIHDQARPGIPTEWEGTGTAHLMAEVKRVLRPGGALFLTTPNAASANVLHKVITGQPPMVYRPHVREYTCWEIDALVKAAGLRLERIETLEPWANAMPAGMREKIGAFLHSLGVDTQMRNEDIFAVARKG